MMWIIFLVVAYWIWFLWWLSTPKFRAARRRKRNERRELEATVKRHAVGRAACEKRFCGWPVFRVAAARLISLIDASDDRAHGFARADAEPDAYFQSAVLDAEVAATGLCCGHALDALAQLHLLRSPREPGIHEAVAQLQRFLQEWDGEIHELAREAGIDPGQLSRLINAAREGEVPDAPA